MAVGTDPARIEWGFEQVRAAARAVGRNPDDVPVGAYVNVSVNDDEDAAPAVLRAALEEPPFESQRIGEG